MYPTHLGDTDISFVLFNIHFVSKFLLDLKCYLLSPKMYKKEGKYMTEQNIYDMCFIYHSNLSCYTCTVK